MPRLARLRRSPYQRSQKDEANRTSGKDHAGPARRRGGQQWRGSRPLRRKRSPKAVGSGADPSIETFVGDCHLHNGGAGQRESSVVDRTAPADDALGHGAAASASPRRTAKPHRRRARMTVRGRAGALPRSTRKCGQRDEVGRHARLPGERKAGGNEPDHQEGKVRVTHLEDPHVAPYGRGNSAPQAPRASRSTPPSRARPSPTAACRRQSRRPDDTSGQPARSRHQR